MNGKLSYKRNCPQCNKELVYTSSRGLKLSIDKNTNCYSCAQLKYFGTGVKPSNWKGYGKINGEYYNRVKRGAKSRNIIFNITIKDMWEQFLKQSGKCAYTKQLLSLERACPSKTSLIDNMGSLDRIDNSKGYTVDNIQWVHKDINLMKNHFEEQYFLYLCKQVVNNKEV